MCCVTPHCCHGVVYTYGVPQLCIHMACLTGFACCIVLCFVYMSPFTVVVLCVCHPLLLLCCMYISPLTIALCVYVTLHCRCVVHLSLLTVVIVLIHHSLPLDCTVCYLLLYFVLVTVADIYITYSLLSCNFSYVLFIMILLFSDFCNSTFSVMGFLILIFFILCFVSCVSI